MVVDVGLVGWAAVDEVVAACDGGGWGSGLDVTLGGDATDAGVGLTVTDDVGFGATGGGSAAVCEAAAACGLAGVCVAVVFVEAALGFGAAEGANVDGTAAITGAGVGSSESRGTVEVEPGGGGGN
jgi:hypothetical protein